MSITDDEFKAREDYIAYLESTTEVQALRIADLEAALMVIMIGTNIGQMPSQQVLEAHRILEAGKPFSRETNEKFKKLYL